MFLLTLFLAIAQTDFGVRTPPAPEGVQATRGQTVSERMGRGTFKCTVRSVTDGDTFRCTNGVRVRLSAIDTPEMPGSCRRGRSCAPGNPHAAKAHLARMIGGATVQCDPVGRSYNRIAAWCSLSGMDLSCAMLRSGHAVRLAQYDRSGRLRGC